MVVSDIQCFSQVQYTGPLSTMTDISGAVVTSSVHTGNVVATGVERVGRQLTYALLDIERRRQAEARSEETQASLQRVIEMAPMAIALAFLARFFDVASR